MAGLDVRRVERLVHHRAQAVDVHAQGIRIGQFLAPDAGLQFLARHHRGRGLHQRLQDLQRGGVELQQLALAADFQRIQVVLQFAHFQHAGLHTLATTGQRVEAHFHFLQRKRLDQIGIGTGIEACQLVVQRIARGQHQHRRLLARLVAQLATDLQAVHSRQVEVKNDRVELVHDRQVQPGHTVGREVDGVATLFQIVAEVGGDIAVVFDDEDAHLYQRDLRMGWRKFFPSSCCDSSRMRRRCATVWHCVVARCEPTFFSRVHTRRLSSPARVRIVLTSS